MATNFRTKFASFFSLTLLECFCLKAAFSKQKVIPVKESIKYRTERHQVNIYNCSLSTQVEPIVSVHISVPVTSSKTLIMTTCSLKDLHLDNFWRSPVFAVICKKVRGTQRQVSVDICSVEGNSP